jgi:hypothetical protein
MFGTIGPIPEAWIAKLSHVHRECRLRNVPSIKVRIADFAAHCRVEYASDHPMGRLIGIDEQGMEIVAILNKHHF